MEATKTELRSAMDWLLAGETGASSKALMAAMLGATPQPMDYPHDPRDLERCLRLLGRIPTWKPRIGEMAACGPHWAAPVPAWSELEALMAEEVGIDWSKGASAPLTYYAMRVVLDGVAQ
jgi:hypothetical protein